MPRQRRVMLHRIDENGRLLGLADPSAPAWGKWTGSSALGTDAVGLAQTVRHETSVTIYWSGSFAQTEGGGLFEADPRTWSSRGWGAFDDACRRLSEAAAGGDSEFWIRPHARHVISDVPSCAKWLASVADPAVGLDAVGLKLLLDPASMLTPEMLVSKGVADHLARRYQAMELPAMANGTVIVANAVVDDEAGVRACGLFEGVLPPDMVASLARPYLDSGADALLIGPDAERQAALLA